MSQNKLWYESRTIWGAAIALAASIAGLFGLHVDAETGAGLASALTDTVTAVGALIAILGRIDAHKTIA